MAKEEKTIYDNGATMTKSDVTVQDGSATVPDDLAAEGGEATASVIEKGVTLFDTYRIESDAIEGGMGRVWRVHHTGWNTDLAMKQPKGTLFQTEQHKENFIHECEAWISLGLHPHIVSCYYVREINGTPTIFSEWMDAGSLKDVIENGSLYEGNAEERLLDIAIQFARGLHYAHECRDENGHPKGLIHQDVKPDNLLLNKDGEAKVADFGISKARAVLTLREGSAEELGDDADSGRTMYAASGGYTPAYCSMEQMNGEKLTRRTDIYSWAVSVMEMYLGERPWANGVIAGAACESYYHQARVAMPNAMKAFLKECLSEDEAKRPHDFAVVEKQLLAIYKAETGNEYPRPVSKAAADTADSLNNRALSFLDLGKPEEAEAFWNRALKISPRHAESLYNLNLQRWRSGQISDVQALRAVKTGEQPERYIEQLLLESKAPSEGDIGIVSQYTVDGICISPDQLFLVDSTGDIFDLESGERLRCMASVRADSGQRIHAYGSRSAFCLSADGKVFFKGNCGERYNHPEDFMILSWDTATGCLIKPLALHTGIIKKMFFDGCKNAVVCVCEDHTICIWDAQTGQCWRKSDIDCDVSYFKSLSPDGKWILTYNNNEIKRLDVDTGQCIQTLTEDFEICALSLSVDGGRILSASEEYSLKQYPVKVWDIETGKSVCLFDHKTAANTAYLSHDEKQILTSADGHVLLWDAQAGRCMSTTAGREPLFSPDGRWILYYTKYNNIEMQKVPVFDYRALYVLCRVSETSKITQDQEQSVRLAAQLHENIKKKNIGEALDNLKVYHEFPLFGGNASYWELKAAVEPYCIHKPVVTVIKTAEDNPLAHFDMTQVNTHLRSHIKWQLKKEKYGKIDVIDSKTQECASQFTCRNCNFNKIYFSPDGTKILLNEVYSYSANAHSIWLISVETGERLYIYGEKGCSVECAYFSPDGTRILCLLKDTKRFEFSFVLLDTLSGQPVARIKADRPQQYAFTPDGRYCLAACDASLSIYDLSEAKRILIDTLPHNGTSPVLVVNNNATAIALGFIYNGHQDITYHQLDWEITFPGWADWDEGARPYIDIFLSIHPNWTDEDFNSLICELQNRGFGWLRPDGVRAKLLETKKRNQ